MGVHQGEIVSNQSNFIPGNLVAESAVHVT